jgi:hypothetical protein
MDFNPYLLAKVQFISTSGNALNLDHNPELKPWQSPAPNNVAGKGQIEEPGQMKNIVWQTRAAAPSAYENALGDALEAVFGAGAETVEQVVEAPTAAPGPWRSSKPRWPAWALEQARSTTWERTTTKRCSRPRPSAS